MSDKSEKSGIKTFTHRDVESAKALFIDGFNLGITNEGMVTLLPFQVDKTPGKPQSHAVVQSTLVITHQCAIALFELMRRTMKIEMNIVPPTGNPPQPGEVVN